jgi:hypothetical protein
MRVVLTIASAKIYIIQTSNFRDPAYLITASGKNCAVRNHEFDYGSGAGLCDPWWVQIIADVGSFATACVLITVEALAALPDAVHAPADGELIRALRVSSGSWASDHDGQRGDRQVPPPLRLSDRVRAHPFAHQRT